MRQSLTKAVTYYLIHEYDQDRFISPPLPLQGDSVANYSARSPPARQSVTNADTYYVSFYYDQVRLIMLPPAL